MQVMCVRGEVGILGEGDIYTVVGLTKKGNYILAEVDVPEPYTSFDASRFVPIQDEPDQEDWFPDYVNEGDEAWPPDEVI